METKKTIGELIEYEVRKQGLSIIDFANKISCRRNNVYDIFKRNTIDIALLAQISKVLNHNFFDDIAKDYNLAEIAGDESEEEIYNRKAVNQFMDVVPKVLRELGKETTIAFSDKDEFDIIIPDFTLPTYCVTFTIGNTWTEKTNARSYPYFNIQQITDGNNISFFYVVNKTSGTPMIDIKLDYKSEDEWKNILSFVFQKFPNLYFTGYGRRL